MSDAIYNYHTGDDTKGYMTELYDDGTGIRTSWENGQSVTEPLMMCEVRGLVILQQLRTYLTEDGKRTLKM